MRERRLQEVAEEIRRKSSSAPQGTSIPRSSHFRSARSSMPSSQYGEAKSCIRPAAQRKLLHGMTMKPRIRRKNAFSMPNFAFCCMIFTEAGRLTSDPRHPRVVICSNRKPRLQPLPGKLLCWCHRQGLREVSWWNGRTWRNWCTGDLRRLHRLSSELVFCRGRNWSKSGLASPSFFCQTWQNFSI